MTVSVLLAGMVIRDRRRGLGALLVLQAVVLVPLLVSIGPRGPRFPAYRVDLDVYRLGATALLHGGDLYGTLPLTGDGQHLPFTYPPFAALLLVPFALVPYWLACLAMTLLTVGLLATVLFAVLRSLGTLPTGRRRWPVFGALLLAAEVIEPVRTAIYAGQVDVLVMALVVADVLVRRPRWPRGLLIGVAAAIKLTPAVFVLYLLLRRDRRAALTAGLSFVVTSGLGFLFARNDSIRYWTGLAFDDTRVGQPWYAGDQSLLGVLSRLGVASPASWLALVALTVTVTVLGMHRALAARRQVLALSLNAVCGLLVSPISWSHHWVWIVVVLPAFAVLPRRMPVALGGGVLAMVAPQWWWPRGGTAEQHWNVIEQLTGNGYVWFGAALLVLAVVGTGTNGERPPHVSASSRALPRPLWTVPIGLGRWLESCYERVPSASVRFWPTSAAALRRCAARFLAGRNGNTVFGRIGRRLPSLRS
ncbi:MAG TPA: glycosyltransferase 87 family protein [Pseudonocardiaceae bacterium]|nr:glycosyltransferase 87 family protein [Pseudonocardiaceae bacterium]